MLPEKSRIIPIQREWSSEELVTGIIRKDPDAGRAFFNTFSKRINRLVWRMLGADSEHDDVVQQVFANAFASLHQLRDFNLLENWLVGITVNTVRRELRSRKIRRFFVKFGLADDLEISSDINPEEQVMAYQLYAILGKVQTDERTAFILCMVEEMTQSEAAVACGCSLSTLKRRLSRACQTTARLAKDNTSLANLGREQLK
jgi:RNA polymerase sigma-70 factor (ECF subfamily)